MINKLRKKYFKLYHSGTKNFGYSDGGWCIKEFNNLKELYEDNIKNPRGYMCKVIEVQSDLDEF